MRRRAAAARCTELEVDALLVTDLVNVRYLTGFTGSNGALLLVADGEAVFVTDGRYTEQARRESSDLERLTVDKSAMIAAGERAIASGAERLGFEAERLTVAGLERLRAAFPEAELVATDGVVEEGRAAKDADELALLRRAQAIGDAAFAELLELFAVGVSERQIATESERLLREHGAEAPAFDPIVAFGEHAAEPHHEPSHRMLEEGDVIVLDFGAMVAGYHADMTRTIAFGALGAELRKVHDVVREAQQAGVDLVAAGVPSGEIDAACRHVIEAAGYGDAFVHPTGHGVGLEIHEAPWVGAGGEVPLPAGAVVTVEPGVYLPGIGGARIEDMVEVNGDGGVVLGTSTRELIEL